MILLTRKSSHLAASWIWEEYKFILIVLIKRKYSLFSLIRRQGSASEKGKRATTKRDNIFTYFGKFPHTHKMSAQSEYIIGNGRMRVEWEQVHGSMHVWNMNVPWHYNCDHSEKLSGLSFSLKWDNSLNVHGALRFPLCSLFLLFCFCRSPFQIDTFIAFDLSHFQFSSSCR